MPAGMPPPWCRPPPPLPPEIWAQRQEVTGVLARGALAPWGGCPPRAPSGS